MLGLLVVRFRTGDPVVELHLTRPGLLVSESLLDRVARDRQQPVRRFPRSHAPLERAVGVQERRLRDVLGVGAVAEHRVRVPVDLGAVPAVEVIDLARSEVTGFRDRHPLNRRQYGEAPQVTSHILTRAGASSPGSRRLHGVRARLPMEAQMARALIVIVAFLGIAVSAALAAPPADKGKPEKAKVEKTQACEERVGDEPGCR